MKQLLIAICLCVASSALIDAAPRKISYDRNGKIFVADVDGTHSKKIAEGDWPEISPDGKRVAFNTEGDAKNRPGPERHIAIADVASGKIHGCTKHSERQLFRSCLVAGWKTARVFNNDRPCVAPRFGERRWLRLSACEECRLKARRVRRARVGARWQIDFLSRSR